MSTDRPTKLEAIVRDGYAVGLSVRQIARDAETTTNVVKVVAHRLGIKHPNHNGYRSADIVPIKLCGPEWSIPEGCVPVFKSIGEAASSVLENASNLMGSKNGRLSK